MINNKHCEIIIKMKRCFFLDLMTIMKLLVVTLHHVLFLMMMTLIISRLWSLTLFLPAMGGISPYMSVTWPSLVGIGLSYKDANNWTDQIKVFFSLAWLFLWYFENPSFLKKTSIEFKLIAIVKKKCSKPY